MSKYNSEKRFQWIAAIIAAFIGLCGVVTASIISSPNLVNQLLGGNSIQTQISPIHGISANQIVTAGTVLSLYIDISGGTNLTIQWRDSREVIADSNQVSIQYTVPSTEGQAFIAVTVTDRRGDAISTSTDFQIVSSSVISTLTPTPSVVGSVTPASLEDLTSDLVSLRNNLDSLQNQVYSLSQSSFGINQMQSKLDSVDQRLSAIETSVLDNPGKALDTTLLRQNLIINKKK